MPHVIRHAQSEAIKKSKRQLTQRVVQARNVDVSKPIRPLPPAAQRLLQRLEQLLGVQFDQLTVNEYQPGVGLSSHVDTHSAFTGASPSSAPCCVFIFMKIVVSHDITLITKCALLGGIDSMHLHFLSFFCLGWPQKLRSEINKTIKYSLNLRGCNLQGR